MDLHGVTSPSLATTKANGVHDRPGVRPQGVFPHHDECETGAEQCVVPRSIAGHIRRCAVELQAVDLDDEGEVRVPEIGAPDGSMATDQPLAADWFRSGAGEDLLKAVLIAALRRGGTGRTLSGGSPHEHRPCPSTSSELIDCTMEIAPRQKLLPVSVVEEPSDPAQSRFERAGVGVPARLGPDRPQRRDGGNAPDAANVFVPQIAHSMDHSEGAGVSGGPAPAEDVYFGEIEPPQAAPCERRRSVEHARWSRIEYRGVGAELIRRWSSLKDEDSR